MRNHDFYDNYIFDDQFLENLEKLEDFEIDMISELIASSMKDSYKKILEEKLKKEKRQKKGENCENKS